jgi:hypothetical protein
MASTPPVVLRLERPRKPPRKTPTGATIKLGVVRAMAEQHKLFERAHEAADRLVAAVRKTDSLPPRTNGGNNRSPKE